MGKGVYSKFNVTLRIKYSNEHEYLDALKKNQKEYDPGKETETE